MLSKILFSRNSKNSQEPIGEILQYWWIYIGTFLTLWFLLYLTGSESGIAFAWALLLTMFFGTLFISIIILLKWLKTGGAQPPSTYWPEPKLSELQADEWAEDLQDMRQSNTKIDDVLNYYRNNPKALNLSKED